MNPFCIERQLSIGHRARELEAKRSSGYRPPVPTSDANAKRAFEVGPVPQLADARKAVEMQTRTAEWRWVIHNLRTDSPEDLPQTKAALGVGPPPDAKIPGK